MTHLKHLDVLVQSFLLIRKAFQHVLLPGFKPTSFEGVELLGSRLPKGNLEETNVQQGPQCGDTNKCRKSNIPHQTHQ